MDAACSGIGVLVSSESPLRPAVLVELSYLTGNSVQCLHCI